LTSNTLAQMTQEEFENLLSDILERKLLELNVIERNEKGIILKTRQVLRPNAIKLRFFTSPLEKGGFCISTT